MRRLDSHLLNLANMARQVGVDSFDNKELKALESLPKAQSNIALENFGDIQLEQAGKTIDLLKADKLDLLDRDKQFILEAIVIPSRRPVIDIVNDKIVTSQLTTKWEHLKKKKIRHKIESSLLSVGRIDAPGVPYAGTGFVVGKDLLMTNRHVAKLFAEGVGTSNLISYTSDSASIDFYRELGNTKTDLLRIKKVVMVHPYWDMALLKVDGLSDNRLPLSLCTQDPVDFANRDIVVIGYPGFDPRGDDEYQRVQAEVFRSQYNAKRLQPGKLRKRELVSSQGNQWEALTHDSSTLGGNSGSCVLLLPISPNEETVVVGLHFAGTYLKANYSVAAFDMAQDPRVIESGVDFVKPLPPPNRDVARSWEEYESPGDTTMSEKQNPPSTPNVQSDSIEHQQMTFTIPLKVSVSLGNIKADHVSGQSAVGGNPAVSKLQARTNEGQFGIFRREPEPEPEVDNTPFQIDSLKRADFSWEAALSCALASNLAYSDNSEMQKVSKNVWKFNSCTVFDSGGTRGFVAISDDCILLSFKGTTSVSDWLGNLNITSTTKDYGIVHSGFSNALTDVQALLEAILSSQGDRSLIVTGHSLGGALATLAAAEWADKFDVTSVYTYGQPAVGRGNFQNFMSQNYGEQFFRFVNDSDIVTTVPPNFSHVGKLIHFDANGGFKTNELNFESAVDNGNDMMNVAQFTRLKIQFLQNYLNGLEAGLPANESLATPEAESIFTIFSDHAMAEYIAKIKKQMD